MEYNKTQLHPDIEFERHIFHRDQFAHYLRWTHVLKTANIGDKILDFGCADGNLLEVLYRNRYKPKKYLGLDIREKTIKKAKDKFNKLDFVEFKVVDLCGEINEGNDWDIIVCFEVIEHIGKQNVDKFLQNIKKHMNKNTLLLLSTPNYDEKVGAAKNHIINGQICELTYEELLIAFAKNGLFVEDTFGTFASQKDYKNIMNDWQLMMFNKLKQYYDSNLISNLMAPFFPKQSRNILWRVTLNE